MIFPLQYVLYQDKKKISEYFVFMFINIPVE